MSPLNEHNKITKEVIGLIGKGTRTVPHLMVGLWRSRPQCGHGRRGRELITALAQGHHRTQRGVYDLLFRCMRACRL